MKITNKYNLPKPLVDAVSGDYKYKPNQFSVTTILKGDRAIVLQKRHQDEIEQDVSDMAWAIFGTAVHSVCENAEGEELDFKETYLIQDLPNGYKLSGRADLYNAKDGMLTDYKTCSAWKFIFKDFADWKKQLLIYAWMIRKQGFPCNKAQIVAFLKDWSVSDSKFKPDYPQKPIQVASFNFTEQDFEEIETFVYTKFESLEMSELLPDDDLPLCSEDERWYSGTKYAVKKGSNIKAVRVFETEQEAKNYIAEQCNPALWIEERKGINRNCEDYCNCNKFCSFYKRLQEEKEINKNE